MTTSYNDYVIGVFDIVRQYFKICNTLFCIRIYDPYTPFPDEVQIFNNYIISYCKLLDYKHLNNFPKVKYFYIDSIKFLFDYFNNKFNLFYRDLFSGISKRSKIYLDKKNYTEEDYFKIKYLLIGFQNFYFRINKLKNIVIQIDIPYNLTKFDINNMCNINFNDTNNIYKMNDLKYNYNKNSIYNTQMTNEDYINDYLSFVNLKINYLIIIKQGNIEELNNFYALIFNRMIIEINIFTSYLIENYKLHTIM
jgi:hypothetical protein